MDPKWLLIKTDGFCLESLERPDACAFLFYPGAMTEPGHYRLFLNFLFKAGFSACALHLSGHGKNRGRVRTFGHMIDEGLAAQEWILKNASASLVIGGHSQGAICALAHAGASSKPAAAFAFSGCLPQLGSAIEATRFRRLARRRNEILSCLKWIAKALPGLPVPLPLYLSGRGVTAGQRRPVVTGRAKSRITYPARFLYSLFSSRVSEKILCPLWLIGARGDGIFSEKMIRETYEAVSAPQKNIEFLPDGGHLAILNPWLARHAACVCACAALSLSLPLNAEALPKRSAPNEH